MIEVHWRPGLLYAEAEVALMAEKYV